MKVRSKQSNGFRPVTVKLKIDSAVELAVFTAIMRLDTSVPSEVLVQSREAIRRVTGVNIPDEDIKACTTSMMVRIFRSLPKQKASAATTHETTPQEQADSWNNHYNVGQAVKVDVVGYEERMYKTLTRAEVNDHGHAIVEINFGLGRFLLSKVNAV
jgi:hypothetical protein